MLLGNCWFESMPEASCADVFVVCSVIIEIDK
jgi:hypothetical protein